MKRPERSSGSTSRRTCRSDEGIGNLLLMSEIMDGVSPTSAGLTRGGINQVVDVASARRVVCCGAGKGWETIEFVARDSNLCT